jgi:hypothetical protein
MKDETWTSHRYDQCKQFSRRIIILRKSTLYTAFSKHNFSRGFCNHGGNDPCLDSRSNHGGNYVRKRGTRTAFLRMLRFPPLILTTSTAPHSSSFYHHAIALILSTSLNNQLKKRHFATGVTLKN